MKKRTSTTVLLIDGTRGNIEAWGPDTGSGAHALIRIDGGERVWVPVSALTPQADGSYVFPVERAHLAQGATVVPVMVEEVNVARRVVETGTVRVRKIVHEREELVAPPVLREIVNVERVPVGRVVEGPVATREEGDTLIVPVLEEALVVEKRLFLVEELRITRRRVEEPGPSQKVTLRREEIVVEREGAPDGKVPLDHT